MSRKLLPGSDKYDQVIPFAVESLRRLADDLESGKSFLVDWDADIELEEVHSYDNPYFKVWRPTGMRRYYLEVQDVEEGERES